MNKAIQVILFDSDGVLAHTEELFFEINEKCFAEIGVPYCRESFEHYTFLTDLGTTGFMITREDYVNAKPAPDGYLNGLKLAGVSAGQAIVVEDSPRGIVAAKAAGIRTIAIPNPVINNLDISDADHHITSLSELPDLLKTIS